MLTCLAINKMTQIYKIIDSKYYQYQVVFLIKSRNDEKLIDGLVFVLKRNRFAFLCVVFMCFEVL